MCDGVCECEYVCVMKVDVVCGGDGCVGKS